MPAWVVLPVSAIRSELLKGIRVDYDEVYDSDHGEQRHATTDLDGNACFVDDAATPNIGQGRPPVDMGTYEFPG